MISLTLCLLFVTSCFAQQQFDPRFQRQPQQGFPGQPGQQGQQGQQGQPPQRGQPGQPQPPQGFGPQGAPQGPPPPPQINWGKCPQLEPKEAEKREKAEIIKSCLESIPLPENITQETVERHRTEVAKCALNKENWFSEDGNYRYEKAESEIKAKQLSADIEPRIINQHGECRKEAQEQFSSPENIIGQVQLYQACMDYHISMICEIQIVGPQYGPPGSQQ